MKILLIIIIILCNYTSYSQSISDNEALASKDRTVYNAGSLDVKPEFPGGIKEFYKFIGSNFNIPEEIIEQKVSAKIFVSFVVEKEGTISEIKVVKETESELAREVVRVLKAMPKWSPGTLNGALVRSSYMTPIIINPK